MIACLCVVSSACCSLAAYGSTSDGTEVDTIAKGTAPVSSVKQANVEPNEKGMLNWLEKKMVKDGSFLDSWHSI